MFMEKVLSNINENHHTVAAKPIVLDGINVLLFVVFCILVVIIFLQALLYLKTRFTKTKKHYNFLVNLSEKTNESLSSRKSKNNSGNQSEVKKKSAKTTYVVKETVVQENTNEAIQEEKIQQAIANRRKGSR